MSRSRSLAWSCWVPLASLAAVEFYARGFDGWGAWATAPLFLIPFALGLAIAAGGLAHCVRESRAGSLRPSSIAFTVLAGLPVLWLFVRRYFV